MASLSQQKQQQYTLGFLKPDVMDRKMEVMQLVKAKTLWTVIFEQELSLSLEQAKVLYPQDDVASWLSSHSIHVFVLKGPDVVKNWYKYVGPKDSAKAKQVSPKSLRAIYGLDNIHNVCHASSSGKEAQRDLTWLQNLIPDHCLSMPLDIFSASLPEQRNHGATTKPTSTNVAASNFSKTSVTTHPAAAASTKHLSTTSDTPSSSSLSSVSARKKKPLTKLSMTRTRPSPSLETPSIVSKPTAQVDRTPQTQQPSTTKYTPSKTAQISRQETKAPGSKDRLVPLTDNSSSDSAKTTGHSGIKRLSNTQGISKTNPGISASPKQQPRKLSSQMEKQQKSTMTAVPPTGDNNTHAQPQQQKLAIETNQCNKMENDMVDSPMALSPLDDLYSDNDNGVHQSIPQDNYPSTTASSSSSDSNSSSDSLASISTFTVDSDHHHDKKATMPISATAEGDASNTIQIVSPSSNINRRATTDVGNLRHEFEALCQNKVAVVPPSSKTSPQLASRIKDLKPKNPSGSRVKSMVAFFMDENLHKWEF